MRETLHLNMKRLIAFTLLSILLTACSSDVKTGQGQPAVAVTQASPSPAAPVTSASPTLAAPPASTSQLPLRNSAPGVPGATPPSAPAIDKESVAVILKTYEERLKKNPNDLDAHYNMGLTLYKARPD